jgi:hypothetical protein
MGEVALMLHVREDALRLEVKRLAADALVIVERVGEKEYVALSGVRGRARAPSVQEDDPAFQ